MTEAVRTEPRLSGISLVFSAWHDPVARILNVDLLTVLVEDGRNRNLCAIVFGINGVRTGQFADRDVAGQVVENTDRALGCNAGNGDHRHTDGDRVQDVRL